MITTEEKYLCPEIPAISMNEMAVSKTPSEIGMMPVEVL